MGYIIALIVALVLILPLFFHCRLFFSFSSKEEMEIYLKLLFLKIDLLKKRDKKEKKKKEDKEKKGQAPKTKEKEKKKGIDVKTVLNIIRDSFQRVKRFLKKLKIRRTEINISVGSPEAAKTAILFGSVNASLGGVIAFLSNFADVKYKRIKIIPNFLSEKTDYEISFEISGRIIYILRLGIDLAAVIVKNMYQTKGDGKDE